MESTETEKAKRKRGPNSVPTPEETDKAQAIKALFDKSKTWDHLLVMKDSGKVDREQTKKLFNLAIEKYLDEHEDIRPVRGRFGQGGASTGTKVDHEEVWKALVDAFNSSKNKEEKETPNGTFKSQSVPDANSLVAKVFVHLDEKYTMDEIKSTLHTFSKTKEGAWKESGDPRSPIAIYSQKGPGAKPAFLKPGNAGKAKAR